MSDHHSNQTDERAPSVHSDACIDDEIKAHLASLLNTSTLEKVLRTITNKFHPLTSKIESLERKVTQIGTIIERKVDQTVIPTLQADIEAQFIVINKKIEEKAAKTTIYKE
eukprot:GHVR01112129.1.p1 GENE.GHVR01112129.1~~GHVR01112129.1.p1  ORF type:complete len:111 (+),score=29.99 GHVR01112129.1:79-411(+)